MAISTRIGCPYFGGQVGPRNSKAVIAAAIDNHVAPLGHVARYALGTGASRLMKMMRGSIVQRFLEGGKSGVSPQVVTLLTEGIPFDL